MTLKWNTSKTNLFKYCRVSFSTLAILLMIIILGAYTLLENSVYHKSGNPVIKTIKNWKTYISQGVFSYDQNCKTIFNNYFKQVNIF